MATTSGAAAGSAADPADAGTDAGAGAAAGPAVAVLLTPKTRGQVLDSDAEQRLRQLAPTRWASGEAGSWDLDALLGDAVACVTGWGTPPLDTDLLARHPALRLVAHTAGSVRRLVPEEALGRVTVCQAAELIADSVAEMVLLQILSGLRELHRLDDGLRRGIGWGELRERHPGRLLGAQTVGVVGASRTGQAAIRLLRGFGSRILVSDPLLDEGQAAALGAALSGLDDLLARSDVVTLHVPLLPQTRGLLGARELALLRDGALLVNSARGPLVDEDALLAELRQRRLRAAVDVFATEPLPPDSPWRELPDVLISPHSAGHTVEGHRHQGAAMVAEIGRFLAGEPLRYAVDPAQAALLA